MADYKTDLTNLQTHLRGVDQSKILQPADKKKIKDALNSLLADLAKKSATDGKLSTDVGAYNKKAQELKKQHAALTKESADLAGKVKSSNSDDGILKSARAALSVIQPLRQAQGGAKPDPSIGLLFNDLSKLSQSMRTSDLNLETLP